mmetsp:Transcript_8906/g.17226  ORF Transcript_8906/g.17226 Transcript_8906/m.17226 type:complete len:470 (+) Transcript_8906:18-1427(+)
MQTHAVDVSQEDVKRALQALGFVEEDLRIKNFEEFCDARLHNDLQVVRYEHHNRKLKERAKAIRAFLKDNRSRTNSAPLTLPGISTNSMSSSFSVPDKEERLEKVLAKQKEVMLLRIQEEQEKFNEAETQRLGEKRHASAVRRARQEALSHTRQWTSKRDRNFSKLQEKAAKERTLETVDRLNWKKSLRERANQVLNQTFSEGLASRRSALQTAQRQREIQEKTSIKQVFEQSLIEDRLKHYQEKMRKHEELHKEAMKGITAKIKVKVQRVKEINKAIESLRETDEIEKVKRLIEKQEVNMKRRQSIKKRRLRQIVEKEHAAIGKRRQIDSRVSKVDTEIRSKSLNLEKRMQTSAQVLRRKIITWNKELSMRHELAKLKNEDTLETAERRKRIEGLKRMRILEKHLRDIQRIEELKQAKELMSSQSREIMIKASIERQRLKSAISLVAHSPSSARTKEVLREFELKVSS